MKRIIDEKTLQTIIKSIVIELPFGLGDQIMCFPLFASIKKAMPEAKITVLSPNKNSTHILSKNVHINNIYEYGLRKFTYREILIFFFQNFIKLWSFFKIGKFDLFIVVHPNLLRTILLKLLPYRNSVINTENTHKTREIENILNQLDIKPVYDYGMIIHEQENVLRKYNLKSKNYILLDIYAQHLEKDPRQWPYFEELILKLQKKKKNIVIAGLNPAHKQREDITDFVNKTSLEELLLIIKNAKLVVAMDSGMFHFSYSLGTPVVGLFGPVNPKDRIPFDKNTKVKVIYSNKKCSPCIENKVQISCCNKENKNCCMRDITINNVMRNIEGMI